MKEIERRFALNVNDFTLDAVNRNLGDVEVLHINQWYLTPKGVKPTLRVRQTRFGDGRPTYIEQCIKGVTDEDGGCIEVEFPITPTDAHALIAMAVYPAIRKTRYVVRIAGFKLEVDLYTRPMLAPYHCVEIEYPVDSSLDVDDWQSKLNAFLASPECPAWVGKEITGTGKSNRSLAKMLAYGA